jgi:hypothetical protein
MAGGGLGVADDLGEDGGGRSNRSILAYVEPGEHGLPAPAISLRKIRGRTIRLGLVGTIFVIQLFFYLETIVQSPILPGDWASLNGSFQFYLLLDAGAFFILGLSNRIERIQSGGFAGFAITYVLFASATWLLVAWAISYSPQLSPITGAAKLQDLAFYGLFVGPTEELFFRVSLPPHVPGGWVTSNVVFALFHIFAYTVEGIPLGISLVSALIEVFLLGCVFYWVYRFFGYGAAVGVHTAYDLVVAGAIGVPGFSGIHLGLIPV